MTDKSLFGSISTSRSIYQISSVSTKDDVVDDNVIQNRMGYAPTLFRSLNVFQNFSFGFSEVVIIGTVNVLSYGYGISIGGPGVFIWSFLGCFIMNLIVALSLAEISAAYPNAGSVYNWTAQLVPQANSAFASYVAGWCNLIANSASDAVQAYGFATYLNAAIVASGGTALSQDYEAAIAIGFLFLWSILNFARVDYVGYFTSLTAIVQMSTMLMISISLLVKTKPLNDGTYVFSNYTNFSGWESKSYAGAIGILASAYIFAGYEGSSHMAEETNQSKQTNPRGIVYTVFATGICGMFYITSLLFATTVDVFAGPSANPAINLIMIQLGGGKLSHALVWLSVFCSCSGGFSAVAVTGRITFALMRDRALPYSDFFSQVHPILKSPVYAIFLVFVVDSLFILLCLSSDGITAFYSLVSICTLSFLVSYTCPIFAKLYYNSKNFPEAPFSLGIWSKYCGILSILYLMGISCLLFLPTYHPVTEKNMNWLIVVAGGVTFLCGLNWLFNARHHFNGPHRYTPVTTFADSLKI
eukprot:gene13126-17593_t